MAEGDEVQEGHLGSEPAIVTFPISPNLVKCLPLERNEYKKSPWDRFPFVPPNFASAENMGEKTEGWFRDLMSWLPLATGIGSRNLASVFFVMYEVVILLPSHTEFFGHLGT